MYTSPDSFLELYEKSGRPLFVIHRGVDNPNGKTIFRYIENTNVDDKEEMKERMEEGKQLLLDFFERYPWGEVTIEIFTSPRSDKKSRDFISVTWGEKPARFGRTSGMAASGGGGFGDFIKMFSFFQSLQNQNTEAMLKLIKENHEKDMKILGMQAETQGGEMNTRDFLLTELISTIKPIATAWVAGRSAAQAGGNAHMSPTIGTTAPPTPSNKKKVETKLQRNHPMQDASIDQIMNCVRIIAEKVFEDFNINEVMPALASMSVQYRDTIRQFVIPHIHEIRKEYARRAQAAKPYPSPNEEEE